jgi:Glycosyl transferases group 1
MRILLWHVHGSWTDAFVRGRHEYLLPTLPDGGPWGLGRAGRNWPASVSEVSLADLDADAVDAVVLQRPEEIAEVTARLGRRPGSDLPAVFLEHNTPKGNFPFIRHPLADQDTIPVVHVTHFNKLAWDNGSAPALVIEHGIPDPGQLYTGELPELAVVVNEPVRRGRVTGTDLLPVFSSLAPVHVFGMKTEALAAAAGFEEARLRPRGDLKTRELHQELAQCRVYLHPMRWTSLGLSLLEAMHLGMPVVALAATEAPRAVPPEAGAVSSDVGELLRAAGRLLANPEEARRRGAAAREAALARYNLARFLADWDTVLADLPRPGGRSAYAGAAAGSAGTVTGITPDVLDRHTDESLDEQILVPARERKSP